MFQSAAHLLLWTQTALTVLLTRLLVSAAYGLRLEIAVFVRAATAVAAPRVTTTGISGPARERKGQAEYEGCKPTVERVHG